MSDEARRLQVAQTLANGLMGLTHDQKSNCLEWVLESYTNEVVEQDLMESADAIEALAGTFRDEDLHRGALAATEFLRAKARSLHRG